MKKLFISKKKETPEKTPFTYLNYQRSNRKVSRNTKKIPLPTSNINLAYRKA